MPGCITDDYRSIIRGLVIAGADKNTLTAVIDLVPTCGKERTSSDVPGPAGHKRSEAEPWGIAPVYVDADGNTEEFSSPSALLKALDLPLSGTVCDKDGNKCRATSVVDILRISGYTVSGDGEPRKKSDGGTKLTVYHPDAVQENPKIRIKKRATE